MLKEFEIARTNARCLANNIMIACTGRCLQRKRMRNSGSLYMHNIIKILRVRIYSIMRCATILSSYYGTQFDIVTYYIYILCIHGRLQTNPE